MKTAFFLLLTNLKNPQNFGVNLVLKILIMQTNQLLIKYSILKRGFYWTYQTPGRNKMNMSGLAIICNSLEIPNIEKNIRVYKSHNPHIKNIIENFKITIKKLSKHKKKLLLKNYNKKIKVLSY